MIDDKIRNCSVFLARNGDYTKGAVLRNYSTLVKLLEGLPWKFHNSHGRCLRKTLWITSGKCNYHYTYGGTRWPPAECPMWLQDLIDEVNAITLSLIHI